MTIMSFMMSFKECPELKVPEQPSVMLLMASRTAHLDPGLPPAFYAISVESLWTLMLMAGYSTSAAPFLHRPMLGPFRHWATGLLWSAKM